MNAFENGDVIKGDWEEYRVIKNTSNGVRVRNMTGETEVVSERELVEMLL